MLFFAYRKYMYMVLPHKPPNHHANDEVAASPAPWPKLNPSFPFPLPPAESSVHEAITSAVHKGSRKGSCARLMHWCAVMLQGGPSVVDVDVAEGTPIAMAYAPACVNGVGRCGGPFRP